MDYAPSGTLRQRHPKGTQLSLTTILPYVKDVAEALRYAHEEKFIHRDVKPENMLVGRRDAVLLSDFGIALVAQSSRYQSTQEVIGTVAYMAPEQIQGKPHPASDRYALGIVVYEWLSGTRPFHGSFTELCTQHLFAPPPVLATSEICSGNGPVLHDGESRFATAVLIGRNIRWPQGQFPLPDSPFPVARNSMERPRGPLPLALSERKAPSCKQKGAFWQ